MANFPINLKKFKKISEDKYSATLRHPDGHEFKIAKNPLRPHMRNQLDALPMANGGKVEEKDDEDGYSEKESAKNPGKRRSGVSLKDLYPYGRNKDGSPKSKEDEEKDRYAEGGEVEEPEWISKAKDKDPYKEAGKTIAASASGEAGQRAQKSLNKAFGNYADGGEVQQDPQEPNKQAPVVVNVGQPQQQAAPSPEQNQGLAHYIGNAVRQSIGDVVGAVKTAGAPVVGAANQFAAGLAGEEPQAAQQPQMPAQVTPQPQVPQGLAQEAMPQAQTQSQGSPADTYGTEAYNTGIMKGVNEQKAGILAESQAMSKQGALEAQQLQQNINNQQEMMRNYEGHVSELNKERAALQKDIQETHIDPNHYMGSMDTSKKVMTAIGLILGGIGAGNAGGPNQVSQFIDQQIDRDIAAQQANLGKKKSLLEANMHQFQNERDAVSMTKAMMNDMLSSQLKMAAAKTADPIAKARALQAVGKLDMETAPLLQQIAMRRTLLGAANQGKADPALVIRAIVPQNEQEKYQKELGEAQSVVQARDNIMSAFDQLSQINTVGNRIKHVGFEPAAVSALRDPLIAGLSKETAGRFSEADAQFIGSLFPAAGDSPETLKTKRIQIEKIATQKMHYPMLKSIGINVDSMGRYKPGGASKFQEGAPVLPKK